MKENKRKEQLKQASVPTLKFDDRFVLLVLTLVFILSAVFTIRRVSSLDSGFHLRGGDYILSGKGWPQNDPFTYTVNHRPYVDTSWGYQVILTAAFRLAGPPGMVVLNLIFLQIAFFFLFRTAKLLKADPLSVIAVLLLGICSCETRFNVRPELSSYLYLSITLFVLYSYAEKRKNLLWTLPVIQLLWANTHALFVLGWGAMACFLAGISLRNKKVDTKLLLYSAVSASVTIINPYGIKGVIFPFTLLTRFHRENIFAQTISELVSPFDLKITDQFPFFARLPLYSFRLFAVLSFLSLWKAAKKRKYEMIFLWLVFAIPALRVIRNIPLLIFTGVPVIAWAMPAGSSLRSLMKRRRAVFIQYTLLGIIAFFVIGLGLRIYNDAYYVKSRRGDRFGWSWNDNQLPVHAAEFIKNKELNPPMLNHLNFGGYLMWSLKQPVFIDGRLEVIGEEFYEAYEKAMTIPAVFESCVEHYGIGWTIFPYRGMPKFLQYLSNSEAWQLSYADGLAAIFHKAGEQIQKTTDITTVSPLAVNIGELPGGGKIPRDIGWKRWLSGLWKKHEFPNKDHNLGLFHLYRGELEQAAERFIRAIEESDGAFYEHYNNLGSVFYRQERYEEALRCYLIVLQERPDENIAGRRVEDIKDKML